MEAFDEVHPVAEAKQSVQLLADPVPFDVLMTNYSCDDDISTYVILNLMNYSCLFFLQLFSDGNILILFEPKRLKFEITEAFPQLDSKFFIHVSLFEGIRKISETVSFIANSDQDEITNKRYLFKVQSLEKVVMLIKCVVFFLVNSQKLRIASIFRQRRQRKRNEKILYKSLLFS